MADTQLLLLGIDGYRHDFGTNEGFDLVVGVAAGGFDLRRSAILIEMLRPGWNHDRG